VPLSTIRLSRFILGVFAAVVCVEKPAEAQSGAWCAYYTMWGTWAAGIADSQHCNDAWPTCAGLAATVHLVHTRPRRGHRVDTRGANDYAFHNNSGSLAMLLAVRILVCRRSQRCRGGPNFKKHE
jgi:hypothetical protein